MIISSPISNSCASQKAAGKTGFLSVLQAQGRLLAARRDYVGRLESVALSVPEIEAACGRPLKELLEVDRANTDASDKGKKREDQ